MEELIKERVESLTPFSKIKNKKKPPQMVDLIMYNDMRITFDFVYEILMGIFNKTEDEAKKLADKANEEGETKIATLPKRLAEAKISQVEKRSIMAMATGRIFAILKIEIQE